MINQIDTSPHTNHAGLVITSLDRGSVTDLEPNDLLQQLAKNGYLILRNFNHSIDSFSCLVRQSSGRISLDPARSFDGNTAQKVDAGYDKVGLHCENGNSPFWPDLCWFYCQKAPKLGSQTTVCDGKIVYNYMSSKAKLAFLEQDIMYSRRVEEKKWKTFAFHSLRDQVNAPTSIEEITLDDLLSLIEDQPNTNIIVNKDHSVYYQFKTSAIRSSHVNPLETHNFANSIFGPSNHYEKPVITFANGESIPTEILEEVEDLCERFTDDIGWKDGDIVLIDNTRVMHGRRKIEDKARTIFNALSYLS
ncbi:MAG: TauD/TfdA family dioxygenase [Neisseria sp.]|uniref:TauD/TfdA family dioxygenase n=1 Tax=Neisseria sp. TaxID=192066 RepID=UPI0026DAE29D|nr:TauD/TfdA family dioxygenase [Neisseria sp.]MDO4641052.1 TauD/TfdA family dioxygenase [Neisseria sp.]